MGEGGILVSKLLLASFGLLEYLFHNCCLLPLASCFQVQLGLETFPPLSVCVNPASESLISVHFLRVRYQGEFALKAIKVRGAGGGIKAIVTGVAEGEGGRGSIG